MRRRQVFLRKVITVSCFFSCELAWFWTYFLSCYLVPSSLHLFVQKEEERPKEKEKVKSRNIDHFMEELKHEQEMRERRNQEREHWHDGRHTDTSTVCDFS